MAAHFQGSVGLYTCRYRLLALNYLVLTVMQTSFSNKQRYFLIPYAFNADNVVRNAMMVRQLCSIQGNFRNSKLASFDGEEKSCVAHNDAHCSKKLDCHILRSAYVYSSSSSSSHSYSISTLEHITSVHILWCRNLSRLSQRRLRLDGPREIWPSAYVWRRGKGTVIETFRSVVWSVVEGGTLRRANSLVLLHRRGTRLWHGRFKGFVPNKNITERW